MTNANAKTETTLISIYLNTWKNYNENGAAGGFWVELPCDLDEAFERLAKNTHEDPDEMEVFINDVDCYISGAEISENDDIEELNDIAEELERLPSDDIEALEAILEADGCTLSRAVKILESGGYIYYSGETLENIAAEWVNDGCFGDIPKSIVNYIDYSAIARDLSFDGYTETENGVICIICAY